MFGEVMGKTKNQLRRDVLKMKLRQLGRHIPAIVGAIGTIAATAIAVKYKNELEWQKSLHEGDWPCVEVTPNCFEDFEKGATLQLRAYSPEPYRTFIQMTTREGGFPEVADEQYKNGTPGFSPSLEDE